MNKEWTAEKFEPAQDTFEQLSNRAKQIYGNVEEAMQDAEEMEGVSGEDYLNLMQEIIDEASKRKSNHERLMDEYFEGRVI